MIWPFRKRHQHDWEFVGGTIVGWCLYRCRTCGKEDIGWPPPPMDPEPEPDRAAALWASTKDWPE